MKTKEEKRLLDLLKRCRAYMDWNESFDEAKERAKYRKLITDVDTLLDEENPIF